MRSGILDTLGLPGAGKPVRLTAVPTPWRAWCLVWSHQRTVITVGGNTGVPRLGVGTRCRSPGDPLGGGQAPPDRGSHAVVQLLTRVVPPVNSSH